MAYSYDIQTSKQDKVSSNCLFACHTLGSVCNVFVSTFLIAYIYQFATDTFNYVFNVGVYQLSVYITFLLTYWLFSLITDKTNRIWVYRVAQLIRLIFIISIIFYGQYLAHHLVLAGFIYGLSEACYYGSYNVLKQEMVSRKSMTRFSTFMTIANKIINLIVPVTLGALIHVSTYEQTSIYVAVLLSIIILISFWIKAKKPTNSNFNVIKYIKNLKANPDCKKIKYIYLTSLVYGFTTITSTLLKVCIMLQFGSSLSLGSITSIIGIVTIIEIFLFTKFTKPAKRNWIYWIAFALPIISSVLFVIHPSMVTVIIFDLLMAVSSVIESTVFDIHRNSHIKEAGLYSEIAEHHTVVETLFTISRVISFTIMILVGLLKSLVVFKILLIVFSLSYSIMNLLLLILENKYIKDDKKDNN